MITRTWLQVPGTIDAREAHTKVPRCQTRVSPLQESQGVLVNMSCVDTSDSGKI